MSNGKRSVRIRQASCSPRVRFAGIAVAVAVFVLGVGASEARPARSDQVTISMLSVGSMPAWQVLVPNFERVYPNITVNVTGAGSTTGLYQLEETELAAGNAPDLLTTYPGRGTPVSVCVLAEAGYLAPMVKKPWVRRSLPLVTSADKCGAGLYDFSPQVAPIGVFTNDDLFKRFGLKVPQTFSQLLDLCQKARIDGTAALIIAGGSAQNVIDLVDDLAVANVYGVDRQWPGELRAGSVSFEGSPGWHQALNEMVELNNAGCFQPGFLGVTTGGAIAEFAQGQGLMFSTMSNMKGGIDALNPQFSYSFRPFPGGANPTQTTTTVHINESLGVNARSSAQSQAAAQTFIDFLARAKQNALYAQILGGLTQYEFLKQQLPSFMSALAPVFKLHAYVVDPTQSWWNPDVLLTLEQDDVGLFTGQTTVDQVLNAMDAAWKQGPA
jgi:raffinose/stachyose/melibiose transport system substrate-binding protein